MRRLSDQRGFTLIELMISMAIGMVAFGGVLTVLEVLLRQSHQHRQQIEAQDSARTAMDQLSVALRNSVANPGLAPTAVERADPYDLVIQTVDPFATPAAPTIPPTTNSLGAMRVRYCLDSTSTSNAVLRFQTQRWTGATAPATPTALTCTAATNGWDTNQVVAGRIVNRLRTPERAVFSFSPSVYASTAAINAVEMTLAIDREPASVRGERVLTSGVTLRNANQPPVADFTMTQASGYVILNGSGSYDPDGDSVTFKWFMDGAEMAQTGRIFRKAGIPSGNHTFRLEVSDSSGLTGSTPTRTVSVT
ncbi:MAG TPA: prepilin-type N-terminal cleavage/methylation domain-containing protein [Solirubrobacteraceae bacterium]